MVSPDKNETIPLYEKYGDILNVSFYIRPLTTNTDTNTNMSENTFSETIRHIQTRLAPHRGRETECVLCQEITPVRRQYGYGCDHPLCLTCLNGCRRNSIRGCPICRREF